MSFKDHVSEIRNSDEYKTARVILSEIEDAELSLKLQYEHLNMLGDAAHIARMDFEHQKVYANFSAAKAVNISDILRRFMGWKK